MKNNQQIFGKGVEVEGFLLRDDGRPVELINGKPAAEFVIAEVTRRHPGLHGSLTLEQASPMVEVSTGVHDDVATAIDEIFEKKTLLNAVAARHGARLVFTPVPPKPFRFIAASSDPTSHSFQLVEEWSKTVDGDAQLLATATASVQFNTSTPFRGKNRQQRWEIARVVHNKLSSNFEALNKENGKLVDSRGRTRLEIAAWLLHRVKAERFAAKGMPIEWSTLPPPFEDVKAMQWWMCAHSDVRNIGKAECKKEHAFTGKIKRKGFWAIETRVDDAVDSAEAMLNLARARERLLNEALCE